MKDKLSNSVLDQLVDDVIKKKDIYGAVFCVSSGSSNFDIISASGEIKEESQYYIASINKFFISAIILKLYTENKIDLEDKISKYLPSDLIQGLHVYNGKDYSNTITINHLMSLTSGLPCYLADKQSNGNIAMKELESGIDQAWPIDKVIKEVKKMKPHFPPGEEGKAKYADTNHHLLSLVIEEVTGQSVKIALKNLFDELCMKDTYVCDDPDDKNFVPIRYKSKTVHLSIFLTSTKYDLISTAKDQMIFLKAFFSGHFFPLVRLSELEKWNRIFFPFKYGVGIQKFKIPRILSPFQPIPEMIGHCGSIGSVAFYVPDMDVYITGTINQQAKPNVSFQAMIKIINKIQ
jgi:CubicO group peptidase (beta-lactamase class C family)